MSEEDVHDDSLAKQAHHRHTVLCFDRDPIEIVKATERLQQVVSSHKEAHAQSNQNFASVEVTTVNRNFCEIRSYLNSTEQQGTGKVTALLADLGLSSMQIDDASRGFTYKREGPLDMRMSPISFNNEAANTTDTTDIASKTSADAAETAYDLLSRISVKEFTKLLQENSDEEHAAVIAQAIVGTKPIPSTTLELAHRVRDAVRPYLSSSSARPQAAPPRSTNTKAEPTATTKTLTTPPRQKLSSSQLKKQLDSTVARVMQAIRIQVNGEFEALDQLLDDLPHILAPGGRAVVLTFHSGEDRRVKKAFKTGFKTGIYSSWSRDVVRPTMEEQRENSRSSCCKLRWIVRSDQPCS